MKKKHFELIANVLKTGMTMPNYTFKELKVVRDLVGYYSETLKNKYPKFNESKFRQACGLVENRKCEADMCNNIAEQKLKNNWFCDGHYTQICAIDNIE